MLIRCSSLPKIMTASRSKSEILSETAKSYIKQIAKEDYFGYYSELDNKYINKGKRCEDESIELLNSVLFTNFIKNKTRLNSDVLTGEADIVAENEIIDIKTSWSLDTFPAISEDINAKDYEMQLRGYMMLYNKEKASVCYCMVDTPEDLITFEQVQLHEVSHIAPEKRVTMLSFTRDLKIEKEIEEKCKASIEFYKEYINKLENK